MGKPVCRYSPVLKLRAPTKIFGDLHGQFGDLMRLFAEAGLYKLNPVDP
jgi:hypothetical protein